MSTSERITQFLGFKRDAPFTIHTEKHKHCSPLAYFAEEVLGQIFLRTGATCFLHEDLQVLPLAYTIMISERGFWRNRKSQGLLVVVLSNHDTKRSYHKKKIINYMQWQSFAKLTVIITSQYILIHISNHYVLHLELIQCYIEIILKKKLTLQKYLLVSTRNSKNSSIFSENLHSVDLTLITSSHLNVKSRLRHCAVT